MLRRLSLRDFVIVTELELDFGPGFTALTGETGAGKSILIDALQLALGSRGDSGVVREGAARADICAEFELSTALGRKLAPWLEAAGFEPAEAGAPLLLRRVIDAQGKGRAWVNGAPATVAQLRELGEHLVDIHGQHAWQSLTRPDAVRQLLDAYGQIDTREQAEAWAAWRDARQRLAQARERQAQWSEQRERLQWQIAEVDKLAPGEQEWAQLNQDHTRLGHAQSILDGARQALELCDGEGPSARYRLNEALHLLQPLAHYDPALANAVEVLHAAQAQLQDVEHTLSGVLHHTDVDPAALQALDERLSSWIGLSRKFRVAPEDLHAAWTAWKTQLDSLEAESDLDALQAAEAAARAAFDAQAATVARARQAVSPRLAQAVTEAMQGLGMAGGRFEVALLPLEAPQSHGLHQIEFRVAGHAGSSPRPLAKVASGGELSRIALAISVCTSTLGAHGTLLFDEVDAGVGGAVAQTVGQMMQRLGNRCQVLTITHLAQVAAYANHHLVVSKATVRGATTSTVRPVTDADRVREIARMLGAQSSSAAGLAHAQEMLAAARNPMPAENATAASKTANKATPKAAPKAPASRERRQA
jgi:DNA repair protein RecN (Recombination protein N)